MKFRIIECIVFVCGFCIVGSMTFATDGFDSRQKIYSVDSDLYEAMTCLYIMQGHALPSTTGPWSADELDRMLAKIDRDTLPDGALATYDYVVEQLAIVPPHPSESIGMKWGFEAALETYTHTNTDSELFQGRFNWNYAAINHKPMLKVSLETWPVNSFYGYGEFTVGNYYHTKGTDAVGLDFGETAFNTNIPGFQNPPQFVISYLNFNMPYRAFASAGGNHWSMQVGRDRMSWGPGVTGNFVVGDNLLYHNMARFTTYFDSFKYTFVTSFFPHPKNYASVTPAKWGISPHGQKSVLDGINMFMSHRLEWRMFRDKVNFALTEAIMYQSSTNFIDLQVLNPVMIYHDYYIRSNSNSILSLELDYTPIERLNVYGQLVIDEFNLPGEPVPGKDAGALPNGFGYMLGVKTSGALGAGMYYGSLEGAMTDPYLYLRDRGREDDGSDYEQSQGKYGINWVVAVRNYSEAGTYYDEEFLGYKYGGDAIVGNLNAGYKVFGKWHVEGNVFFMAHGTHDKWTCWTEVDPDTNVSTPTTGHNSDNHKDPTARTTRNAISYTLVTGVNGGYTVMPGFDVFGQLDLINIWNPGNISTAASVMDMQLTLGLTYSI